MLPVLSPAQQHHELAAFRAKTLYNLVANLLSLGPLVVDRSHVFRGEADANITVRANHATDRLYSHCVFAHIVCLGEKRAGHRRPIRPLAHDPLPPTSLTV